MILAGMVLGYGGLELLGAFSLFGEGPEVETGT